MSDLSAPITFEGELQLLHDLHHPGGAQLLGLRSGAREELGKGQKARKKYTVYSENKNNNAINFTTYKLNEFDCSLLHCPDASQ